MSCLCLPWDYFHWATDMAPEGPEMQPLAQDGLLHCSVALLSAALCLARSKGKVRSPLPADALAQELMESEKSLKCLKILGKPYAWHYLSDRHCTPGGPFNPPGNSQEAFTILTSNRKLQPQRDWEVLALFNDYDELTFTAGTPLKIIQIFTNLLLLQSLQDSYDHHLSKPRHTMSNLLKVTQLQKVARISMLAGWFQRPCPTPSWKGPDGKYFGLCGPSSLRHDYPSLPTAMNSM